MTIEEVFKVRPEDPETETAVEQLAKYLAGKTPCNEDGTIDYDELGYMAGEKAKSIFDDIGVVVRDGDQANDVLAGAGISLLKTLFDNREALFGSKKGRQVKMAVGFAEALGLPEKLMAFMVKHHYK